MNLAQDNASEKRRSRRLPPKTHFASIKNPANRSIMHSTQPKKLANTEDLHVTNNADAVFQAPQLPLMRGSGSFL